VKYRLSGLVTVSVSILVEAPTEEAAREVAGNAPMQGLCFQCSTTTGSDPLDPEWRLGGELDGEPKIITVSLQ
jgi:hypothetical protein